MTRRSCIATAAALLALAVVSAAVAAPRLNQASFRYVRGLERVGGGPARFEPDGRLYAHTKPGFADLRVVLPDGSQVPWRRTPEPEAVAPVLVDVLYRGRQGARAVALFDVGATRRQIDRIALDVADRGFVGRAEVLGSDDRKTFVKLSTTVLYDVAGAATARSTTAVFPPAEFRYYLVRASGINSITGASIEPRMAVPRLVERPLLSVRVVQKARTSVVVADLGFRRVPVDMLRLATATRVFDRRVQVDGSNDGLVWTPLAAARVSRLPDSVTQPIDVAADQRFLRVTIENGDDAALARVRLTALARSRAILVRGGVKGSLRILYGSPLVAAPEYDYALLPASALTLDEVEEARLGPEIRNPLNVERRASGSFFDRHSWLVGALLAAAAVAIGATGLAAALRPRPPGKGEDTTDSTESGAG
jgi:hypothetical protein